jgi:site-specific recombinase XerD
LDTNTRKRGHQYITLTQLAELYFVHAENFLKKGTLASYQISVRQFVVYAGDITTNDLTDLQIVRWMRERLKDHKPNTVRGDHRRLSAWLSWAHERGIIERNWAKLAKPPSEPDQVGRVITEADFRAMLVWTKGSKTEHRDRALLHLLWDTGMRIGEAAKLEIEMLQLKGDNPVIQLPAAITKTNQARVVGIDKECRLALYDYLALERKAEEGPLFVNSRTKEAWHEQTGKHIVRELGQLAGIDVGAHDFRRAFVGRMQKAGMSDTMIMKLTGHKTIAMISRYGAPNAQENALLAYRRAVAKTG